MDPVVFFFAKAATRGSAEPANPRAPTARCLRNPPAGSPSDAKAAVQQEASRACNKINSFCTKEEENQTEIAKTKAHYEAGLSALFRAA